MPPNPPASFIQLYGPVLAASVALLGVLLTLIVTSLRDRKTKRIERENAYRTEARAALAVLLTAAKDLERVGMVMADPARWVTLGYERATVLADSTEASMKEVQQGLVTALLLITDKRLEEDLTSFQTATDSALEVIHEANDAFWESRPPGDVVADTSARWAAYRVASGRLVKDGRELLRPLVR